MFDYTMIDSDSALKNQLDFWKARAITSIAMDFEGEFNLHIYGEHLCLVQIFDGVSYFLIDPFKVSAAALKLLFEDASLEKVMFDCASDAALLRKQYTMQLQGVHDVRVSAQLLGYTGNLSGLVARCLDLPLATGKKGKQTANWLRRPIKPQLIEYALSDVEHLFAIREVLNLEIAAAGLAEKDGELQKTVALAKGPERSGWEKLNGYRYLSPEQKIFLKWFFEARDTLARQLNLPAFRILDKRVLVSLAKQVPQNQAGFRKQVTHKNRRIEDDLVVLLMTARDGAIKELSLNN